MLDLNGSNAFLGHVQEIQRLRDPTGTLEPLASRCSNLDAQRPMSISEMADRQFNPGAYKDRALDPVMPAIPAATHADNHPGIKPTAASIHRLHVSLTHDSTLSPHRLHTPTPTHITPLAARLHSTHTNTRAESTSDAKNLARVIWRDHRPLANSLRTPPEILHHKASSLAAAMVQKEVYTLWRLDVMGAIAEIDRAGGAEREGVGCEYEGLKRVLAGIWRGEERVGRGVEGCWGGIGVGQGERGGQIQERGTGQGQVQMRVPQGMMVLAGPSTHQQQQKKRAVPLAPSNSTRAKLLEPNHGFSDSTNIIPHTTVKRPAEAESQSHTPTKETPQTHKKPKPEATPTPTPAPAPQQPTPPLTQDSPSQP